MTDIAKLPTDNLYKFIAIFGLILLLSTFLGYYLVLKEKGLLFYELDNNIMAQIKIGDTLMYDKHWIKDNQLAEKLHDNTLKIILNVQDLDNQYRTLNFYSQFLYLFAGLSFLLMIFGFLQCYNKTQKYLDIILKNQVEQIKKDKIKK